MNEPHPTPPPPVSRSTQHMPWIDDRRDEPELVWYGHPQFPYADHPPYAFGSPQPHVRGAPVPYMEPVPRGEPVDRMRSTEGEGQRRWPSSVNRLRETAARTRPSMNPPQESLEDENRRLRAMITELQRERLELQYQADRAILECQHIEDVLDSLSRRPYQPPSSFAPLPERGYHPYPHPDQRQHDRHSMPSDKSIG